MFTTRLTEKAHKRIEFIVNRLRNDNPFLRVEKQLGDVYIYNDFGAINRFDFYACQFCGGIGSLAIYGQNIKGYYDNLSRTRNFFGLEIEKIFIDQGIEEYLDIHFTIESSMKDGKESL